MLPSFQASWRRNRFHGDPLLRYLIQAGVVDPSHTFARASEAAYADAAGVMTWAAADVLRSAHYQGAEGPLVLLEGARTNRILHSRDLTNAAWAKNATVARDAVGIDAGANAACTVTDADAAGLRYAGQTVAIANGSEPHTLSLYLKKDADETRFPEIQFLLTGGTTVRRDVQVNTATGAHTLRTSVGEGSVRVDDAGSFWRVQITLTNNATGNTAAELYFYPAMTTSWGMVEVAATGSVIVDQVQMEPDSPSASSPIRTTTAALTRSADALSLELPAAYLYQRYVDPAGTVVDEVVPVAEGAWSGALDRAYSHVALLKSATSREEARLHLEIE